MDEGRKNARKKLKEATKSQYTKMTDEAALTPSQKEALDMHILEDLTIVQIAVRMHISERTVADKLAMAYKKISSSHKK